MFHDEQTHCYPSLHPVAGRGGAGRAVVWCGFRGVWEGGSFLFGFFVVDILAERGGEEEFLGWNSKISLALSIYLFWGVGYGGFFGWNLGDGDGEVVGGRSGFRERERERERGREGGGRGEDESI